ncbi:unnamed protein product [Pylaiella littoralis]
MSRISGAIQTRRRDRQGTVDGGRSRARSIAPALVLGACMIAVLYGNASHYFDNSHGRHSHDATPGAGIALDDLQSSSFRGMTAKAVAETPGDNALKTATKLVSAHVSSKKPLPEEEQLPEPPPPPPSRTTGAEAAITAAAAAVAGEGMAGGRVVEIAAVGGEGGGVQDRWDDDEGTSGEGGVAVQSLTVGGSNVTAAGDGGEGEEAGGDGEDVGGDGREGGGGLWSNGGEADGEVVVSNIDGGEGGDFAMATAAVVHEKRSDAGASAVAAGGKGGGGGGGGRGGSLSAEEMREKPDCSEGGAVASAAGEVINVSERTVHGGGGGGHAEQGGGGGRGGGIVEGGEARNAVGEEWAEAGASPSRSMDENASEAVLGPVSAGAAAADVGNRDEEEKEDGRKPGGFQAALDEEREEQRTAASASPAIDMAVDSLQQQEQQRRMLSQGLLQPGEAAELERQHLRLQQQHDQEQQKLKEQQERERQELLQFQQQQQQKQHEAEQEELFMQQEIERQHLQNVQQQQQQQQQQNQQQQQQQQQNQQQQVQQQQQLQRQKQQMHLFSSEWEEQLPETGVQAANNRAVRGSMECPSTLRGEAVDTITNIATWKNVPGDAFYMHPNAVENVDRYVTVQKDLGGFNNVRLSLECGVAFAAATGRTFVIPPPYIIWNMNENIRNENRKELRVDVGSLFSFDKLRASGRVNVITAAEFLAAEAATGGLGIPPSEDVMGLDVVAYDEYMVQVASQYEGGLPEINVDSHAFVMPRRMGETVNLQDPEYAFAKEWLYDRQLLEYRGAWADAKVLHFRTNGARLLTPFYGWLLHADEVADRYYKRLMRDLFHYPEEVYCKASQIISMLEEEDPSGVFSTFHVRRNDFPSFFAVANVDMEDIIKNSLDHLKENEVVYVATDEKDHSLFESFKQHTRVRFLSDYYDRAAVDELDQNLLGMLDQIIASHGRTFTGCWLSTFTAYILRLRGYLHKPRTSSFYYFLPQKTYHHDYKLPHTPLWMSEWPFGWEGIDATGVPDAMAA